MPRRKLTPYEKGRVLEYYCRKVLEHRGADHVVRTARSRGVFDLIAIFTDKREIWLVQVKKSKTSTTKDRIRVGYGRLSKLGGLFRVIPCVYTMTQVGGKDRYEFVKLSGEG